MSKKADGDSREYSLIIQGAVKVSDIIVLVFDILLIVLFAYIEITSGDNMLFLIIPLSLIAVAWLLFFILPDTYCFYDAEMRIKHILQRQVRIPYDSVFNIEANEKDRFLNITQNNCVKLYYQVKKKKMIICNPRQQALFIETIKEKCPEFQISLSETKLNDLISK